MAKSDDIYAAAKMGFLGHSALLDPATFTAQNAPSPASELGPMVAQNSLSLEDRLRIPREVNTGAIEAVAPKSPSRSPGMAVRSDHRAAKNAEMAMQGSTPEQIKADEAANPMNY